MTSFNEVTAEFKRKQHDVSQLEIDNLFTTNGLIGFDDCNQCQKFGC